MTDSTIAQLALIIAVIGLVAMGPVAILSIVITPKLRAWSAERSRASSERRISTLQNKIQAIKDANADLPKTNLRLVAANGQVVEYGVLFLVMLVATLLLVSMAILTNIEQHLSIPSLCVPPSLSSCVQTISPGYTALLGLLPALCSFVFEYLFFSAISKSHEISKSVTHQDKLVKRMEDEITKIETRLKTLHYHYGSARKFL
jgi:hypothetical protein